MAVPDETSRFFGQLADPMARMMEPPRYEPVGVSEAKVVAVHDDGKIDVEYKGAVLTVPATTACDDVAEDDTALLTRYGAKLYATGVLSTGNPHYVKTGYATTHPVANENVSQHIDFDEPFPSRPVVLTNPLTGVPGIVRTSATNITADGFDLVIFRTSSTQTGVDWLAYL